MLRAVGSAAHGEGDGLRGVEPVVEEAVENVKHFKDHCFAEI